MSRAIFILAAHADDEALGCGGTIRQHADAGDEVAVLFLTNGVGARTAAGEAEAQRRAAAMRTALGLLGVQHHRLLDFPDNRLDQVALLDVVQAVQSFLAGWQAPAVVYTHHPGDLNIDHQIAHRAALTCFRPQPGARPSPDIFDFEVPSSTGWHGVSAAPAFQPNYFRDITGTLPAKIAALRAYGEEMRPWPHARSLEGVEALARMRGCSVGLAAAEAFVVERVIVAS